eukprot:scaffold129529_cov28-Tisochrysis_lutea.AAC.1
MAVGQLTFVIALRPLRLDFDKQQEYIFTWHMSRWLQHVAVIYYSSGAPARPRPQSAITQHAMSW